MIADIDAREKLVDSVLMLLEDKDMRVLLGKNIAKLAIDDSDEQIAKEIMKLAR